MLSTGEERVLRASSLPPRSGPPLFDRMPPRSVKDVGVTPRVSLHFTTKHTEPMSVIIGAEYAVRRRRYCDDVVVFVCATN